MKKYVEDTSIVKEIWTTTDITLFIFAGASAEFALNKQVDWLFFTGKLPADPIGRLFSTIKYAQYIISQEEQEAITSIKKINSIHENVESMRGFRVSNEGYQDVLFMLIYYSIAAFELLKRKLTDGEKDEIVSTFVKIGRQMHIQDLDFNYIEWKKIYESQLTRNLVRSSFTNKLYKQYKKHLGGVRYFLLLDIQRMLVPNYINHLLDLGRPRIVQLLVPFYKQIRKFIFHKRIILMMIPRKFKDQVKAMDRAPGHTSGVQLVKPITV